MKRNLFALAGLTLALTANAGWFSKDEPQAPAAHPYAMQTAPARTVGSAPAWFTKLPQDTPDMLFSAGTAQSMDEQMAYDKARIQAERKLAEMMYSRVKSSTNSYRNDTGDAMAERTEVTVQRTAEGDVIGAQRVDSQATFDGRYYKVYVLLRYPLAENNVLRKEREAAQVRREAELRAARAHQDLERNSARQRADQRQADKELKEEIGPRPEVVVTPLSPQDPPKPAVMGPETVKTSEGDLKLLEVDNAEYRARRAEALTKPGAVVGNSTYR